jgi:hypothetical protein
MCFTLVGVSRSSRVSNVMNSRLPFTQRCESRDLTRPRIKSGEQGPRSSTLEFVLHARGPARARRKRQGKTRARLQIRLFIEAQYPLPSSKWAGIQLNQKLHLRGLPLIARHGWRESHRWERHGKSRVRLQNLPNGLEGNARDNAIGLQLAGQFGAMPLRQGTPKRIRSLTSQLDYIESHLGGKHRWTTRTRPLTQASYAQLAKASGPFSQMEFAQANLPGCGRVALPQVPSSRSARARLTRPEGLVGQRNQLWICARVWSLIVIWIVEKGPDIFTCLWNLKSFSLQENNWKPTFYPESFLLGGVLSTSLFLVFSLLLA